MRTRFVSTVTPPALPVIVAALLLLPFAESGAAPAQQRQQRDQPEQREQQQRDSRRRSGERTSPALPLPPGDDEVAERIREGATMEEIAQLRDPIARNPEEAVRALKTGNSRFFGGEARRPELAAAERRAQILGQSPFAVILGCSDSRVPVEIVFDQALGSLFVIRVAGNIVEPATAGTVEYGVKHLKSHVIVVMGHEGCGAVSAAMLPEEQRQQEPENVRFLLNQIRPSVENIPALRDRKARLREAVINNVRFQVHQLKQNKTVTEAVKSGQLQVIGAYYEIASGAIDFLEREEDLRLSPEEQKRVAEQARDAVGAGHRH